MRSREILLSELVSARYSSVGMTPPLIYRPNWPPCVTSHAGLMRMPVHRVRIIGVVLYYVVYYKLCEVSASLRQLATHRYLGDWLIDT